MLKNIIEGLVMAATDPLQVDDLLMILNDETTQFTREEVQQTIDDLMMEYKDRGIQLQEVARGYRFQVATNLVPWLSKLYAEKPPRYSRALLESLALIAYKQPVTRAEIEEIRGVSGSYNVMKTLLEHEWVKVAGYKNVPGRPALFVTTNKFLDYFNLKSLEELPPLAEDSEIATKVEDLADNLSGLAGQSLPEVAINAENSDFLPSEEVIETEDKE